MSYQQAYSINEPCSSTWLKLSLNRIIYENVWYTSTSYNVDGNFM